LPLPPVRIAEEVQGAVGKDGTPSQYQMTTSGMLEGAGDATWAAIQSTKAAGRASRSILALDGRPS